MDLREEFKGSFLGSSSISTSRIHESQVDIVQYFCSPTPSRTGRRFSGLTICKYHRRCLASYRVIDKFWDLFVIIITFSPLLLVLLLLLLLLSIAIVLLLAYYPLFWLYCMHIYVHLCSDTHQKIQPWSHCTVPGQQCPKQRAVMISQTLAASG